MAYEAGSIVSIQPALHGHWNRGIILSSAPTRVRVTLFSVDGGIALNGEGLPDIEDLHKSRVRLLLGPPTPPTTPEAGDGNDSEQGADRPS